MFLRRLLVILVCAPVLALAALETPAAAQDGPAPRPEPKPEPEPAAGRAYGDNLALDVPASVRKQMEDQAVAITRMRLYFNDAAAGADGVSLEFEDMRTEVPVIFAAFIGERCDRVLNYADYSARPGRHVDLAFHVKTLPRRLKGMKVQIEHAHIQGEAETSVATFDVPAPDEGEPWNDVRLRGARPGVNRYRMVVSYTGGNGQTTTYKGFSHLVLVQAPPMFEFTHTAHAAATSRKAGNARLIAADVRFDAAFLLHAGLNPADCSLRVVRRGKRDMRLDALSPEVRRVLEKERAPLGWHEVGRGPLAGAGIPGLETAKVEEGAVVLRFRHVLNASTTTLPLDEDWQYRFELLHKGLSEPMAVWECAVKLKVEKEADLATARLNVTGTALDKPLSVPIQAAR